MDSGGSSHRQMVANRYVLEEVIGSGGMATVWRGRDTHLDRAVAVKRPHPLPPGDPRHDRLAREARLAASVSHPNLIEVHDAGSDDQGLFLVMEYVDARSLRDLGPTLDRGQILTAGSQVAHALAAIHSANVVHRDVKPANVLLPANGAKLLDFGVALAEEPMPGFEPTRAGVVFGTKGYAAPEVLAGQPATAASDIFALGVMMYELLAGGEKPYNDGAWAVEPAALTDRAGPFLARCLSVDPTQRPTAAEAAEQLERHSVGGYDQTVVMTAPSAVGSEAQPPPPSTPPPPGQSAPSAAPVPAVRGSGGGGIGWLVLLGVLLFAVVGLIVSRQISGLDAIPDSGPTSSSTADAVATTTTSTTSTTLPTTTSTTEPSTSSTTGGPAAEADAALGSFDDEKQAERIAYETIREGIPGNGRPGDEAAEKVAKKIGDAFKETMDGDPEEALKKLEEGAEEAAERLDGFSRTWTLAVLDTAARRMDLGDPEFSVRYAEGGSFDEDD